MKKVNFVLLLVFITFLVSVFSFKMAHASFFFGMPFGGKITKTTATEIQQKEYAGYVCPFAGKTVEVLSKNLYPTSFAVPFGTRSGKDFIEGSNILGIYLPSSETISCINTNEPYDEVPVVLNKVIIYGVSPFFTK